MAQNWLTSYEALKTQHSLTDDALGVFAINLRFDVDDIQTIVTEAITGGGDDKKCDVIYVDKERQIAVVAQCFFSSKNKEAAPANKASDLNTAVAWLLTQDIDSLPNSLKGRADELRTAVNNGEIKQFYVWYVHNLPNSKNVADELKAVEKSTRSALKSYQNSSEINIFAEEIGSEILNHLYLQAERTIIVTEKIELKVDDLIRVSSKDWEAVLTTVSGAWLYDIYSFYKTDLFSANLRGYLGARSSDSNINNGIKNTANSEPNNFYVYNNGITALTHGFNIGRKTKGGIKLILDGISIVNGAQTTGSIGNLKQRPDKDLRVPIRFVKASNETLVSNIVQYNNSQNKIQAADFRSNDSIQQRLRQEFSSIPDAEYEGGRRGGASDAIKRNKFTLPSYTVGQALAAFHGDPVTAYDKKSELWTEEGNYRKIFTERTTAGHIVFCYSLLSAINNRKIELNARLKIDPTALTQTEKNQLDFLNKKGAAYLMVYALSQSIETVLKRAVPNRFDLKFGPKVSPKSAETNWLPIIDIAMSLSKQLDAAFNRNRVSNEGLVKAIEVFSGVFNAVAPIQAETFQRFAASVKQ